MDSPASPAQVRPVAEAPPARARCTIASTASSRDARADGAPETTESTTRRPPRRAARSIASSSAARDAAEASVARRMVSMLAMAMVPGADARTLPS